MEETPLGRAKRLLAVGRYRAKRKGLEFALDLPWLQERMEAGVCEATGLPFDLARPGNRKLSPLTPSLDRINPNYGYTKQNTQLVCWAYNRAKGDDGPGVLIAVARGLLNQLEGTS